MGSGPGSTSSKVASCSRRFRVNTTLDSVVANLKTGRDAAGQISLRSAIQAANAKPNADTIIVPAGTYNLTLTGANDGDAASGDLTSKAT